MRALLSTAILLTASVPAFAALPVPEPEMLSLVAIGVAALVLARRRK